jgi:uncharacterized protein YecE (DUF72 family)
VGCCGFVVARARYFGAFDLVEIQESFYALPRLATVERWRTSAPAGFEFILKATQLITHAPSSPTYRRLRTPLTESEKRRYGEFKPTPEVRTAWIETLARARALDSRLVLFQSPASFTPTAAHVRNLTAFFESVERDGLRFAWEPRGRWPDATVRALCRKLSLIHCVDPFQQRPVWGEPAYFRLHGKGGYRYRYADEELRELRALVAGFGAAYVLFNNNEMFDDARRFLALLRAP